jgi:hypothetical protein
MSQNIALFMALLEDQSSIQCRLYSFYVVRVSGVLPTLMTLGYQGMGARDVVQKIMNHFL